MENICYYCGNIADTIDHVIPYSFLTIRKNNRQSKLYSKNNTVPACKECNCLASNLVFNNLEAKKDYIQERLEKRYKKILEIPDWSEEQLKELGYNLKKNTKLKILAKKWVINRLSWPNIIYPEQPIRAELQKIRKLVV